MGDWSDFRTALEFAREDERPFCDRPTPSVDAVLQRAARYLEFLNGEGLAKKGGETPTHDDPKVQEN